MKKVIKIYLKYATDNSPVITKIERVSRPGSRTFAGKDEIPQVQGGLGIAILTTAQGVMTGRTARKQGVGGEILCRNNENEPGSTFIVRVPVATEAATAAAIAKEAGR